MKYKAYTQKEWNAERFYIEDENQKDLIMVARNAEEAKRKFRYYILLTSMFDSEETKQWLEENPITVEEV